MIQAKSQLTKRSCRIAVVVSLFNQFITGRLQQGCVEQLQNCGISQELITIIEVPGAVELPLIAKKVLETDQADVVIVLGCVIRGDTDHYDYVCQQVSQGCQQVALEFCRPVIFGVLTTDNEEQALSRVGGRHGHKGVDAADAALAMYDIIQQIQI